MKKRSLKDILSFIQMDNIADELDKDELITIGNTVYEDYQTDKDSRRDWETTYEDAMNLAKQVADNREYAGEKVSDVKYPTIASAAIQYAARAYPAIIKGDEVLKHKVIGADPQGIKAARGMRVSTHMNYQIMEQMDGWEDGMDQLLVYHALVGNCFKKTYYCQEKGQNVSEIVLAEDLVVNYYAKNFDDAPKTQILKYSHNQYRENVLMGIWRDIDLQKPDDNEEDKTHTFFEQHRLLDLDDDGYEEPYIVTIEEESKDVVRVVARFDKDGIQINTKNEIVKIIPEKYYTEFPFMPSFDGSIYRMGFGILLSPLNHSINTLFNQLIDAGSLATRQGGFLGRGIRLLRGGESGTITFKRGEWKHVQSSGDDLRKNIFPLPVNEPSSVLFQLLGMLLAMSKELASQSELLSGSQNQSNIPATSTLALIEQGLQVYFGVHKRVYRSMRKEFNKLHKLNAKYLNQEEYQTVLDDPAASVEDYRMSDYDIRPVSTTSTVTTTQKYMKAQAMVEQRGKGMNDMKINKFFLEALEIPDIEEFLNAPPPPPDPVLELEKVRVELEGKRLELEIIKAKEIAAEKREKGILMRAQAIKAIAEAEAQEVGTQFESYMNQINGMAQTIEAMDKVIAQLSGGENVGPGQGGMGAMEVPPPNPQSMGQPGEIPAGVEGPNVPGGMP